MTDAILRIGTLGLGRAFTLMLPTFVSDPRVEIVAAAEPLLAPRKSFAQDFTKKIYEDAEALCCDPNVDVG